MKESVTVEWHGAEFEVEGEWIEPVGARKTCDPSDSEPADGGYFDCYDTIIRLGDADVTDLLTDMVLSRDVACDHASSAYDLILGAAAEELLSQSDYDERSAA